ncbi:MAG: FAD-dependent monooxygenase, partial [Oscillospiraceae bacterium]|nr:FAD-dependent monooxygenase [Oscillospiraceae bacterium]
MLRVDAIKTAPGASQEVLRQKAAAVLRVSPDAISALRVLRRSIDAREGVLFVWSVAVAVKNEASILRRARSRQVSRLEETVYTLPPAISAPALRPVVVGAGPAGLFCALVLARCGARPIILERGKCVEERRRDVQAFWETGRLDPGSNVQFGEGGAGAFSDGKLNTGTKDPRHAYILQTFVSFGAPEDILIDAKPHVGT